MPAAAVSSRVSTATPTSATTPARLDEVVLATDHVRVGQFRAPVGHPAFGSECRIGAWHLIAFPRSSVVIEQIGRGRIVSDPHLAMLYNARQRYLRYPVSADGDRCEWFAYAAEVVREALGNDGFDCTHATVGAGTYLLQRMIWVQARKDSADEFTLEVAALGVLDTLAAALRHARGESGQPSAVARQRHRELADAARHEIATCYQAPTRLATLAARLDCSPYHLCHVFRRVTGTTVARYQTGLRLRAALERLAETPDGLTDIGLDLGFSSHSHFTSQFSRVFGMPPSSFRANAASLAAANKNLKAFVAPVAQ